MSHDVDPAELELRAEPANPNLTREARRVLAYVQSLPGEGWLVGQQEPDESVTEEQAYVEEVTGKRPSLRGFDMAEYIVDPVDEAIRSWREHGQLVTLSWHLCRPLTESDFDNVLDDPELDADEAQDEEETSEVEAATEHFRTGEAPDSERLDEAILTAREDEARGDYYDGEADVEAAVTEGTDQHEWMMDKLDWMADELERLAEEGVPVLWRPYHEMDGGWFWWSSGGPEPYVALWKQMFDHFVEERGLDNLVWVWSRSHEPKSGWYPGDEYVDVTGVDTYRDVFPDIDWEDHYRLVLAESDEKPVALAECDEIPDPGEVKERHPFVWVHTWQGPLVRYNDEDHLRYVYEHPYTITAEDLPEF